MGLILYRCPDDFPARIPEVLFTLSPPVICESLDTHEDFEGGFCHEVKRGKAQVSVYGSCESGPMIVSVVTGSLNPLGWRASGTLYHEVVEALLGAGMEELTVEELEKPDALERASGGLSDAGKE